MRESRQMEHGDHVCAICLHNVPPCTRIVTECNHVFHFACLELWVVKLTIMTHLEGTVPLILGGWHWTCPVCRRTYSHLPKRDDGDGRDMGGITWPFQIDAHVAHHDIPTPPLHRQWPSLAIWVAPGVAIIALCMIMAILVILGETKSI